jgi:hypothetical protein
MDTAQLRLHARCAFPRHPTPLLLYGNLLNSGVPQINSLKHDRRSIESLAKIVLVGLLNRSSCTEEETLGRLTTTRRI